MRQRIRSHVTSLALVAALAAGSLGPPAIAAPDAATAAVVDPASGSAPTWLQALLSWLDRILVLGEPPSTIERPPYAAAQESGAPENPVDPGLGVSPQGGPDIDPNG